MINKIKELLEHLRFEKRKKVSLDKCGNYCLCPRCGDILNDQAHCVDTDLVRYVCGCGCQSTFNFDIGPCPILVKENK